MVAALLFVIPSQALAANWVKVATRDDQSSTVYIDTSTIKSNGSIRRYWERTVYVDDPDGWKESRVLAEINCATDQKRALQIATYRVDGNNSSFPLSAVDWIYIVPGTIGEISQNFVCP